MHVQEIIQNSPYILIRGLYSSLNVCMLSFSRRHRYMSQVYCLLSLHAHFLGLCKGLSSLLKPSHHLNTVIFYIADDSSAICNKLKVSVGRYHKFKKNFIAVWVSFTSRKTTFCIFLQIGLTKTNTIPLLFENDVGNLVWNIKWHLSWCWCSFSRFEQDNFEIWWFLKHDITELMGCWPCTF